MRRPDGGLTLIEIVIALTIAAVLFSILLWSMRLGHRSVDKGMEREDISQRMRVLTDRLTWLLRGTYPYIVTTPEGNVLYFSGTEESVGFVSTSVDPYADTLQDSARLKWITLYADREGLKIQEDVFFADVFEDEPRDDYLFDPTVTSLEFEYLDTRGEDDEGEWVEEWDPEEKGYLPSAVRITLSFDHEGREVEMPPLVVALRAGQLLGEPLAEER
ncbi:MAG: prepilin-type N-terminal cleavage/methylation domain-containing protein [Nitrospirota bacterium]|jgi:prepilin-type N-terminal cleavage/methylation domain-containing protein